VVSIKYANPCAMETTVAVCSICQKPKSQIECGLCKSIVCKNCTNFLDGESFSFLSPVPEDLTHLAYCRLCYDAQVAPAMESYQETLQKAQDIQVFFKSQGKETRLIKRSDTRFDVPVAIDRDETILRLAFFAVQANFNAIIDVEVVGEKVHSGRYQTSTWKGTAVGAHLKPGRRF